MERVKERRKDLERALKNFYDSIQLLNQSKTTADVSAVQIMVNRDSVIKRFELCYDLLWKSLKDFLEINYGILVNSPKKVFQEARVQNLITIEQLAEALSLADDRNLTAHIYDDSSLKELPSAQSAISI